MIVVDTCGWIEYLTGGSAAEFFAPSLEDAANLLVPTLVQYELYKWAKRERDEARAVEAVSLTEEGAVVPISSEIALIGADLALNHGLAMADALILAVASKYEADLATCDSHFEGLSQVRFVRK